MSVKFHVPGASQPLPFKVVVDAATTRLQFSAELTNEGPAVQYASRRAKRPALIVAPLSPNMTDSYRGREGYTIGVETIEGSAIITLDLAEVRGLVARAARNKNGKSQEGPVQVKFTGTRKFTPEVQK